MRLDFRSLAVFRIVLGLLVLCQSVLFSCDFAAFYQTDGVFPSHVWSEPLLWVLIFGVLPLFAISLLIGFVTRLSTLICLVGVVLVQDANPQILQGGDVLLRLLLFWSLFLPLGQIGSFEARWMKAEGLSQPWTTRVATWAFTFQICFVYWFASLLKSDPLWTQDGNALFYALNIEHFTTPFGLYLRQFPDLLRVMTLGTPWFELAGPCLLFIPFHRDACRLVVVALFMGFHLIGMEALLRIGLFPWVCAAAWLIFIPGSFWDWLKVRRDKLLKIKPGKRPAEPRRKKDATVHSWPVLDYACSFLVVVSFLDVLAWNIASVSGATSMQWMNKHDTFGNIVRLDQRWNMYAPAPRKEHGWLVVPADLANGSQVDLFTGQAVSWEKPKDIGAYFGNDHWRRYLSNLFDDQDPQALQGYADYLVRNWNQYHREDQKIQAMTITFMRQETQPDLTITPPEKDVLYFHAY
jgi:vitamin K-dependent gamma-carboxylase-like protein